MDCLYLYAKGVIEKTKENTDVINFYNEVGMPYTIYRKFKYLNTFVINSIIEGYAYIIESESEAIEKVYSLIKITDNEEISDIKPDYYTFRGLPCDKIQELFANHNMNRPKVMEYYEGNVIKYLYRYCKKNGIEDLRKARTYISFLISLLTTADEREDKDE